MDGEPPLVSLTFMDGAGRPHALNIVYDIFDAKHSDPNA